MQSFNVIVGNFNTGEMEYYDVMPYLVEEYKKCKKRRDKYHKTPKTFEEFKEFVKAYSMYKWWARCEYEVIVTHWPPMKDERGFKMDVHWQVMMNIDVITRLLMESVVTRRTKIREE